MNKKIILILAFILILITPFAHFSDVQIVKADELDDVIDEELNNLDLSDLEKFLDGVNSDSSLFSLIGQMLKGEFQLDYNSIFGYIIKIFLNKIKSFLPEFFVLIALVLLCCIIQNSKSFMFNEEISEIISFIFVLAVLLIVGKETYACFKETQNLLENLTKFAEIMSPIMLTLVVAGGGNSSAVLFKPTMVFASGGFTLIVTSVILPLVLLFTAFSVMGAFTDEIKFKGFSTTIKSILKWIIGLLVVVFGIFTTIYGIAVRGFDGISLKVAKYLVTNSIPLVGGMVKDGFDIFVCGCAVIKNAIGIAGVFGIFYLIISPILLNIAFSLLLKIASAYCETLNENAIGKLLTTLTDTMKYLNISIIISAFSFLICILTMTLSFGSVV